MADYRIFLLLTWLIVIFGQNAFGCIKSHEKCGRNSYSGETDCCMPNEKCVEVSPNLSMCTSVSTTPKPSLTRMTSKKGRKRATAGPSKKASKKKWKRSSKKNRKETKNQSMKNPFSGRKLYVNPSFQRNIRSSIRTASGIAKRNLRVIQKMASAYWLDQKSKVVGDDSSTDSAAGILADAGKENNPPVVTFVVYDVPNRDCAAKASNGEICCAYKKDGTCDYLNDGNGCQKGIAEYKKNYIDPLATLTNKFCRKVPMAFIIEPDSLPNLITNTKNPKCGNEGTRNAYRQGITYAVKTLSKACPSAALYLDAAHGGWLGWENNMKKWVDEIAGLGIYKYLRGFATNVANMQPLGVACPSVGFCFNGANSDHRCCKDPCKLSAQYNPANNEMNFVSSMAEKFDSAIPNFKPRFVIDSARNGVDDARSSCSNWCNIRGLGIGKRPTTNTGNKLVDALLWIKTPGESDGCTEILPDGGRCPRFDTFCASKDSIGSRPGEPRAPEAGEWFDFQIKMLARNAKF